MNKKLQTPFTREDARSHGIRRQQMLLARRSSGITAAAMVRELHNIAAQLLAVGINHNVGIFIYVVWLIITNQLAVLHRLIF